MRGLTISLGCALTALWIMAHLPIWLVVVVGALAAVLTLALSLAVVAGRADTALSRAAREDARERADERVAVEDLYGRVFHR